MKRMITLLMIILLYNFCGIAQNLHLQMIDKLEFDKYKVLAGETFISDIPENYFIVNTREKLVIMTNNDIKFQFINCYTDNNHLVFNYLGYIKKFNAFFIKVEYMTYDELWIIDISKKNIIKTQSNYIILHNYILTYDMPNNDNYRGLSIFRFNNTLYHIMDIKPEWFISDNFNKGNILFFKVNYLEKGDIEYYKLELDNVSE